jgi:osmotically-inducible protein OsmY
MKNAVIFLLLGAILGALSYRVFLNRESRNSSLSVQTASVVQRTQSAAAETKQAITSQLADWNLTSADIKADFAKAGKVVRTKTQATRETISDARIVAVLKGKYAFDGELSALAINIDCVAGRVTLQGHTASAELIGKAIRLALETDGVTEVESLLAVESAA